MSTLNIEAREESAKPKALRRQGIVPMALVAKDGGTQLFQAQAQDVRKALARSHGAGTMDLQVSGGDKLMAMVKSVDRDILSRQITHVTLMQVAADDTVKVDIPVVTTGTPEAVTTGEALLATPMDHLKVKGKINEIPDNIEIDVSGLTVGQSIHAGEVQLPQGLELLTPEDVVLATCTLAKEPELEAATDAEAAPSEVPTVGDSTGEGS